MSITLITPFGNISEMRKNVIPLGGQMHSFVEDYTQYRTPTNGWGMEMMKSILPLLTMVQISIWYYYSILVAFTNY